MRRPYVDAAPTQMQYPVHMVGHDHERVQCDTRKVTRDVQPASLHGMPCRTQTNGPANQTPQQRRAVLRTDCDEIGPRLAVVEAGEAD